MDVVGGALDVVFTSESSSTALPSQVNFSIHMNQGSYWSNLAGASMISVPTRVAVAG